MNEFLAPVWDERTTRLRLGVEPVDALGSAGILPGLGLHLEDVPRPHPVPGHPRGAVPFGAVDDAIGLPGIRRSPFGRFAVSFGGRGTDTPPRLAVRIVDPRRRYVPRRLSIPVADLATVRAAEQAHDIDPEQPLTPRACRPALFPGADYLAPTGATVLRGRVTWGAGGPVAAWVRVEARATAENQPEPWRAHGDDRGEFLLVIGALSRQLAVQRVSTVEIAVTVLARPLPPAGAAIDSPSGSRVDPLWHLPVEPIGSLDPADAVAAGIVPPAGYVTSASHTVLCRRGAFTRLPPFVLT